MRFLFVYQDYAKPAQQLLDELSVRDVRLIIARKGATGPTPGEIKTLEAHSDAEAAVCAIVKKYQRTVKSLVQLRLVVKEFRPEDRQLREWLVPNDAVAPERVRPSEAFTAARQRAANLAIHEGALAHADEIAEHRWGFAKNSVDLLVRYANGEQLGPPRDWKAVHGVDFAGNGRVAYKLSVTCGTETCRQRSEWHLKSGDRTTRESAARIYFARVELPSGVKIVVSYVGPHPDDGEYALDIVIPM